MDFKKEYPLHILAWSNNFKDLESAIHKNRNDLEKLDPRGRTPLMLAVTLGHLEATRMLLRYDANVNVENKDGFSVVQEAISTGDPELLKIVLERRDFQRYSTRVDGIPSLLQKLKDTPDFYVEMKWEFTSWVPLVSRMCPSDTYKVYKSGSSVRIDTTLLGFDDKSWKRGSQSYIFKGLGDTAQMMEIDHRAKKFFVEEMKLRESDSEYSLTDTNPSVIAARLTSPIVATYVDTDKISFERNKSGVWGWRNDKTENVNEYECKVFAANNVELVTKTRTEHLTESDRLHHKTNMKTPLQNILGGMVEVKENSLNEVDSGDVMLNVSNNPCNITMEEYFDPTVDLTNKDIGRPKDLTTKIQKFRATLWLCEDYPLSLQEQILPIIDLMAINSTHFAKLRDFITLQLPAGFAVKIEIPIFHIINARITFGNILATEEIVAGVTSLEKDGKLECTIDDSLFEAPTDYKQIGSEEHRYYGLDEDDELLQYAIQQSLVEAGSEEDQVTIWEALTGQKPSGYDDEEAELQRAIQESMSFYTNTNDAAAASSTVLTLPTMTDEEEDENATEDMDNNLELALKLSLKIKEDEDRQRKEDEELLAKVLALSQIEQ